MQEWPPDYSNIFNERIKAVDELNNDRSLWYPAREYYRDKPHAFIEDWCITYDPRNSSRDLPTVMPFAMFDRQHDFVDFLLECLNDEESGLVEKCRDVGATWVCCAFSVWLWLFYDGASVGWGSRKEQLVDKLGDPDSIFEKMRMIVGYLPKALIPVGFNENEHSSYMKLINPENGSTITGEAGDNIGRGGRKLIYFKDESAHYERPDKIEASLADNTNCQIDISSVNGTANIFYRRRMSGELWTGKDSVGAGQTKVFVFDWSDHPGKTQAWYDARKAKAEREGLLHIFKREVDRDYSGSIENTVIPSEWVKAVIDAHVKLKIAEDGQMVGSLDVADEGQDKNALCFKKGIVLKEVTEWAQGDTGQTARKAVAGCKRMKADSLQYDCIGVGAGVKAETNRLKDEGLVPKGLEIVKWNASQSPLFPTQRVVPGDNESPLNKDFFSNINGQAWWQLRIRCEKTFKMVSGKEKYPHDELISISSDIPLLHELTNELTQVTYKIDGKGKVVVDKKPKGTKSPNLADTVKQAYWPIQKPGFFV